MDHDLVYKSNFKKLAREIYIVTLATFLTSTLRVASCHFTILFHLS